MAKLRHRTRASTHPTCRPSRGTEQAFLQATYPPNFARQSPRHRLECARALDLSSRGAPVTAADTHDPFPLQRTSRKPVPWDPAAPREPDPQAPRCVSRAACRARAAARRWWIAGEARRRRCRSARAGRHPRAHRALLPCLSATARVVRDGGKQRVDAAAGPLGAAFGRFRIAERRAALPGGVTHAATSLHCGYTAPSSRIPTPKAC